MVDDEIPTRELLRLHLSLAGFDIEEAGDGREALDRLRTDPFELIILDVVLPNLDGVTICRAIRSDGPNKEAGVLMVTARVTEADKVVGLDSGADDYLTKPFGVRELVARIGAIMRRCRRPAPEASEPQASIVISRLVRGGPSQGSSLSALSALTVRRRCWKSMAAMQKVCDGRTSSVWRHDSAWSTRSISCMSL